jgi:hypothetical protein
VELKFGDLFVVWRTMGRILGRTMAMTWPCWNGQATIGRKVQELTGEKLIVRLRRVKQI